MAIDCRHAIQGSVIALEFAQKSLPQVEFQHISQRQISAVRHANVYLLTDMANVARCQHTKMVLNVYQSNVEAATKWLHETFQRTLRANLSESESSVIAIVMQLRRERMKYMSGTIGKEPYLAADTLLPS